MKYFEYCKKARGAWPSVECLGDLSFVLYYVPDVDCLQAKRYFSWDERKEVVKELGQVFENFSLRDSFLKAVRESRIRGKKHWKKRRWKLPLKKRGASGADITSDIDIEVEPEVLRNNMEWAVNWAVKNQDLSSFDVFLESYKELARVEGGTGSSRARPVRSNTILKLFIDKVEKMK